MSDEDPKRAQRALKRNAETCGGAPKPYVSTPPVRPILRCEEIDPQNLAQLFAAPVKCPTPAREAELLPDPLLVVSEKITRKCGVVSGTGPHGDPVTLPEGQFKSYVYFQALTGISQQQLTYIGTLSDSARDLLADPATSLEDVRRISLLNSAQAVELQAALAAAQVTVNDQANTLAVSSLDCYWQNTQQQVVCDDTALLEAPEGYEDLLLNPATVAAGAIRSSVSQAVVDAEALALAEADLLCLWANREQIATCHDHLGYEESVPVDTEVQGQAPGLRIGSATVAAGEVISTISQEDADAQALQQAISALECFYINDALTRTCAPDSDTIAADVNAADNTYGNPVTIPLGAVVSYDNAATANQAASDTADGLLVCEWSNTEQTATCPAVEVSEGVTLEANEAQSPVYTTTIEAGSIQSSISQADANASALLQAQLALQCVYCNQEIQPTCYPESYTVETIPVPFEDITSSWSSQATRGAAAETICSEDPISVQQIAEGIAILPIPAVEGASGCPYGNYRVIASCVDPEGAIPTLIARPESSVVARGGPCIGGNTGSDSQPYWLDETANIADMEDGLRVARFDATTGASLSSLSYPNPFAEDANARQVVIAEDVVTIYDAQVPANFLPNHPHRNKLYATELAINMGLSTIDCFFANCPAIYHCDGTINAGVYDPPFIGYTENHEAIYGTGRMIPIDGDTAVDVAESSIGSLTNPLTVGEAQFTSRVSQLEVDAALMTFLLANLKCFWINPRLELLCGSRIDVISDETVLVFGNGTKYQPPPRNTTDTYHADSTGAIGNPVIVPEAFQQSTYSPEQAQLLAFQFGLAQLDCFFRNVKKTASCKKEADDVFAPGANPAGSVEAGLIEGRESQYQVDAIAAAIAAAGLNCIYASGRVFISGSGGGGTGVGNPCAGDEQRFGPDALDEGFATSSVGTAEATAAAGTQLQSMQSCGGGPQGPPGTPGGDGAQRGCSGPCNSFFS